LILAVIRNDPADVGLRMDGVTEEERVPRGPGTTAAEANNLSHLPWKRAMTTGPFWLISGGYFTCGFTVTLFSVHIIPYATDLGFDFQTAAGAVAFSGFFNILGTITAGTVSDRLGRKNPLAVTYFVRGMYFVIFILWQNLFTLYLFAAVIGFSYFATVPLTAGLTGDIYGPRNMGVLYGTMTGIHQVGSAVGAYLGGKIFDLTGTYQGAFLIAFLLLMSASLLSFLLQEARYREAVPAES
ncbi:MAG: MFS transporter, partial [bacterium]